METIYKNLTVIEKPRNVEDLFPLVEKECKLIKENFSQKEISNLYLEDIDPNMETSCIYGRMDGSCNSKRVYDFIQKNIDIVVKTDYKGDTPLENLNKITQRSCYFMTPLEEFIFNPDEDDEDEDEKSQERVQRVLELLQ